MIEAARYIGYERLWVDDFWFDAKGNWNGIFGDDWREINAYLRRQGMLFRLWMPPWHADRLSKVWVEHPEWMLDFHGNWYNWTIDMSQEDAYQWVLNMLCEKQKEFGTYDLRVDGDPCNLKNNRSFMTQGEGGWNCTLKQSEQFYRLYREFKERNPKPDWTAVPPADIRWASSPDATPISSRSPTACVCIWAAIIPPCCCPLTSIRACPLHARARVWTGSTTRTLT